MVLIPTVKWAQRKKTVFLTIDVQDSKDPKIELTNTEDGFGHLIYKSVASGGEDDKPYELDLTLFKAIDKESSKISASPRSVILVLEKAEEETWPRLTKESGRHLTHIKVDWDRWVDSDDEGDGDGFDLSGMGDFSSMGGMGGMGGLDMEQLMASMGAGGMGGMPGMEGLGELGDGEGDGEEGSDSDDDELPPLEDAAAADAAAAKE